MVMRNLETVKGMILSAKSILDAAMELMEDEACLHPPDRRKDLSTMGHRTWQCLDCGYLHEEVST